MSENLKRYRASEKGKATHREYMRSYMNEWRKRRKESADYDPEDERRKWREQHQRVRERAMERLGGKFCSNCGCDDFAILEINHIHGGGRKSLKSTQNRQFYRAIMNDKIDLSAYNVLCRVCNALHFVRDVLGIAGHHVVWRGSLIG